jgi:hypothetical protein
MSLVEKYNQLNKAMVKKDEDKIEKIFGEILKEAIELINKKAEKEESIDIKNPEEAAAIRAMFEYMLELWAQGDIEEAKELGYDMAYSVEDKKLKEMFSMFVLGMLEGLSVDEFFDKYVNENEIYKDVFFTSFNDEIDELIVKHKKKFEEEFSKEAK